MVQIGGNTVSVQVMSSGIGAALVINGEAAESAAAAAASASAASSSEGSAAASAAAAAATLAGAALKANNLSDLANAATARTNLGLAIGTNVQAYDADLAAIAALTSAADRVPYSTGAGTWSLATLTSFARTLLATASNSAFLAALGQIASTALDFLQTGTGAATRTVQAKLREVKDRDDFTSLQAAIDAQAAEGGIVNNPVGTNTGSGVITLKRSVSIAGKGVAHHAFYAAGTERGTVIKRASTAAGYSVDFEANSGYGGNAIRDLSIYHYGANTARAVLRVAGIQHARLRNVEIATLSNAVADYGLLLEPNGAALTLYGGFDGVRVVAENGSKVSTALGIFEDTNGLAFNGGSFSGHVRALEMGGTTLKPINVSFCGTAFEGLYSTDMEHVYVPGGVGVVGPGVLPANCYIVKLAKITKAQGVNFSGCYFELGATPSTYDDGVNGVLPLYAVVSLEGSNVSNVTIDSLETCNLYDGGAIGTYVRFRTGQIYDTTQKPVFSARKTASQSIPNGVETPVLVAGSQLVYRPGLISYDDTTGIGTVHVKGVYQITGQATFDGFNALASFVYVKIASSGGNAIGPNALVDGSAGVPMSLPVSQVVSLSAGHTFSLNVFQATGVSRTILAGAEYTRLSIHRIG